MEFYPGLVPIEAIIGNQGGITALTPTGIHFASGFIFHATKTEQGRYVTDTGLEAIHSKHGILLFVAIREGIKNGAYSHKESIYAHWDEVEKACSTVVKEHVYDAQERPDIRQELACRMIYNQQALKHVLLAQGCHKKRFKGFCDAAYSTLSILHRKDKQQLPTVSIEAYRDRL